MPIWFQAVRSDSPLESGIKLLPLVIGLLVFSVGTGYLMSYLGRYKQFQIIAAVLSISGVAVLATIRVSSSPKIWVTGLLLIGMGAGTGISCPFIAAQVLLPVKDISIGMALMTFSQDFGEALMIGSAQTVFLGKLRSSLTRLLPAMNPVDIINLGATNIKGHVSASDLMLVFTSYSMAVQSTFFLACAIAAFLLISAILVKDRSLK